MRLKVTPGMSLAVSMLALVMASTGTAVAAKSMLTGKDIKDGSITSADIAKGAIKSKHLAKKSVKGANIADGGVGKGQIDPYYVPPPTQICASGVIIIGLPSDCPTTWADARATNPALPNSVPLPGGGTCYGAPIPFQDGSPSSVNSWDRASGFYYRISTNPSPTLTVNMTWGNTQDVTTLGLSLMKLLPNGQTEPVPNAQVKIAPAATGDTASSLAYAFPPGTLKADDHFSIEAYACTTGAAPQLKSVEFYFKPMVY